jgi:predicted RNA binding protein YcfA (HicA-like mRNA interferase family)
VTEKLPRITALEMIRVLEKACFALVHQSRSHKIYKNQRDRRAAVPFHTVKILHPKLVAAIRKDADLTPDDLKNS